MGAVALVLVFTFPGQGSQRAGMGEPWVDHPSWEVVEEASIAADRDLARLLLSAPIEELTQTENAQLATTALSLVVLDAVERTGLTPAACAGHSLGEYTALGGERCPGLRGRHSSRRGARRCDGTCG